MCPRCRQNAPLVYRGVSAYCTACGAPRMPLAGTSVTHAGTTSKVGGTVARVAGWSVLAGGWAFAALFAGLIYLLGGGSAALVIGGPIALLATLVGYALLRSGAAWKKSGDLVELATKKEAIFALARARGNVLQAADVAQMLHVGVEEGDAILTQLAKEDSERVTLDLDDEGRLLFHFVGLDRGPRIAPNAPSPVPRPSFAPNAPYRPNVERPDEARYRAPAAAAVRVDARDPLEDAEAEEADATDEARKLR